MLALMTAAQCKPFGVKKPEDVGRDSNGSFGGGQGRTEIGRRDWSRGEGEAWGKALH